MKLISLFFTIFNIILRVILLQYTVNLFLPSWGIPINVDFFKSLEFYCVLGVLIGMYNIENLLTILNVRKKEDAEEELKRSVATAITIGLLFLSVWLYSLIFI